MELIHWFIDFILHLDKHLTQLVATYHVWVYVILFLIVFCETGLVVTPFLPGDSLLFAAGALAAVDETGTLNAAVLWISLTVAAILGKLPTVEEYLKYTKSLDPMSSDIYRYLNFNELSEYTESAAQAGKRPGALPLLQ